MKFAEIISFLMLSSVVFLLKMMRNFGKRKIQFVVLDLIYLFTLVMHYFLNSYVFAQFNSFFI